MIIELSLNNPYFGQFQVTNHLKKSNRIDVSASGVRHVGARKNASCGLTITEKVRTTRVAVMGYDKVARKLNRHFHLVMTFYSLGNIMYRYPSFS